MANKDVYGGAIQISPQLIMELLRIKGELVHIESDPVSKCFTFFVKGGAGEFPKVAEGVATPRMRADCLGTYYGDQPRVVKTVLVNLDDGKEYVHFDECSGCIDGTYIVSLKSCDGSPEGEEVLRYTNPRTCLGSSHCKFKVKAKEPMGGIAQPSMHCDKCTLEDLKCHTNYNKLGCKFFNPLVPKKDKCEGCLDGYNHYGNTMVEKECHEVGSSCKLLQVKEVVMCPNKCTGTPKDRCRSYGMSDCRYRDQYKAEREEKERMKEGKKGVESKWYCTFSPANLCGKLNCKECSKFESWKSQCEKCDGYSKEHFGDKRPKNTCYESSKCKFRDHNHTGDGLELMELARRIENDELVQLIPNCRFYPQSFSCSFPESKCAKCSIKEKADSEMCKTCGQDHGQCKDYGKGICKFTPKYLGLQEQVMCKVVANIGCHRADRDCNVCDNNLVENKGDETKNETSEKEDNKCLHAEGECIDSKARARNAKIRCQGCSVKEEIDKKLYYCEYKQGDCKIRRADGCDNCHHKKKALKKEFTCPYNPEAVCNISKDKVGGLECVSCREREPKK